MPYTSHGFPYGLVDPSKPAPPLTARCGGPSLCDLCRGESMRNLPALAAICAHCGGRWVITHTCALPAPPADALAMPTGVHYSAWLDQIAPTLVALGWTPPPGPADPADERRDRIAEAIRQAAERCECDGSCVCGLGIDCYLGSRTDVVVVGKPSAIAAAVLSAGSVPAEPAPPAELTEAQRLAEQIILSHTEDIEFGTIGEMLDDEYERLGQDAGDRLRDEVDRLITEATVTVSWPERAEDGA